MGRIEDAIINDLARSIWWDEWHSTRDSSGEYHKMLQGRPMFSGRMKTHRVRMAEHESRCACDWHIFKCSCGYEVRDTPYYAVVAAAGHYHAMNR